MNKPVEFNLQVGRKIGPHYEVIRILGRGSEGEVYQVVDTSTGIYRAAKIYYSAYSLKNNIVEWQAQKLHKLRRCNIVLQYHHKEIIQIGGIKVLCLISDFCEGLPLEDWICRHRGKRLHSFIALHILYELAKGLEEIHILKEYHGDVHSQNILLQRVGVHFDLKLTDFYGWGRANIEKRQQDILDAIAVFIECLGGKQFYSKVDEKEIRYICAGMKHGLILKRFPTMSALRQYLYTFDWKIV